jgi:hypothetical protein
MRPAARRKPADGVDHRFYQSLRRKIMTFEELKTAILNLSEEDQKRLILEVVPEIWPKACTDDACLVKIRELVDEDAVRAYREQNLGGI